MSSTNVALVERLLAIGARDAKQIDGIIDSATFHLTPDEVRKSVLALDGRLLIPRFIQLGARFFHARAPDFHHLFVIALI